MEYNEFKKRAEILKAMAHPVRLMIIEALSKREHCVCELNEFFSIDQSTLSRHLSVLKSSGLVTDDKRGLKVFYQLTCPCILKYMDCISAVIK